MCNAWVRADGAWPEILRMGSNPKGTSAHRMVFWARFSQSGMGRSRRTDLAGLLMRTGPLPSRRKQRTDRSEVGKETLRMADPADGGGRTKGLGGFSSLPAPSAAHAGPRCFSPPKWACSAGGCCTAPVSSLWVPSYPEQPPFPWPCTISHAVHAMRR